MNLKELAAKLQLSPTTVSRALNGCPEVNGATRDRAVAAAEKHNYRANSRAIRLATGRAQAVGHVLSGMGIRRAIEANRQVMGRDVSVLIFDDDLSYLRNGLDVAIFSATRSSVREAGRIAAEMLLQIIADPGSRPEHRLLEAELIFGQSTGPAPNL